MRQSSINLRRVAIAAALLFALAVVVAAIVNGRDLTGENLSLSIRKWVDTSTPVL